MARHHRRTVHSFLLIAIATLTAASLPGQALGQGGLPYTIAPPEGSVDFGRSVASGGDVDGDGLPDIFVSDPAYANQNGVVGRWFVYSGADGSMIWSVTGERPFTQFFAQYAMVGAFLGDLDGDGRSELIVGTPHADEARGAAYVHSGRTSEVIYEYIGVDPDDRLGEEVAGLSDLNGDLVPEFAVVTDAEVPGSVVIYNGATGLEHFRAAPTRDPARRVRNGGDLDGDKVSDIIIGTQCIPRGHGCYRGEVQATSGRTGSVIWTNQREGYLFGWTVATGADLTGDHVPDVLTRWGPSYQSETILLISGATGETVLYQPPLRGGVHWGSAMAFADVNADDRLDLVAMRLQQQRFGLDVVDPKTRRLLHWAEGLDPTNPNTHFFGNEMAVADVNGDDADDFIIGSEDNGVSVFGGGALLLNFAQRTTDYEISRGQPYDFTAGGGMPGRTMRLLGSISGNGCTFIPQLGICIDLDQRIYRLGAAVTDPERVAHFTVQVPLNMPLGPVWLQAVDPADPGRGPITSNVMRLEVVD